MVTNTGDRRQHLVGRCRGEVVRIVQFIVIDFIVGLMFELE